MKRLFAIGLLVFVLTAVFVAPVTAATVVAQPASAQVIAQDENPPASDVVVPDDLGTIIKLAIGLLVTQGLKSLSKLFNADISGWGAALTASIATSVILFFDALLSAVPDAAEPSVAVLLTLIVTILGAFGLKDTLKSFQK